jgi:hypothetical protein
LLHVSDLLSLRVATDIARCEWTGHIALFSLSFSIELTGWSDNNQLQAPNTIVVSDRRNMRFEFFNYDPDTYEKFEWCVRLSPA